MNINMGNRSDELKVLFKKSLKNSRGCITRVGGGATVSPMYKSNRKICRIYFYEWSDISRKPLMFEDVSAFEHFLRRSGIYLKAYEAEMCENLGAVYVSCLYGSKQLCIRGSYGLLCETMNANVSKELVNSVQALSPNELLKLINRT